MGVEEIIQKNEGTVVDVRTAREFLGGHASGSVNIPLNEVSHRLEEIKKLKTPIVLCCASGGRSAQAHSYLVRNNIDSLDGGSWIDVHYWQEQKPAQP